MLARAAQEVALGAGTGARLLPSTSVPFPSRCPAVKLLKSRTASEPVRMTRRGPGLFPEKARTNEKCLLSDICPAQPPGTLIAALT